MNTNNNNEYEFLNILNDNTVKDIIEKKTQENKQKQQTIQHKIQRLIVQSQSESQYQNDCNKNLSVVAMSLDEFKLILLHQQVIFEKQQEQQELKIKQPINNSEKHIFYSGIQNEELRGIKIVDYKDKVERKKEVISRTDYVHSILQKNLQEQNLAKDSDDKILLQLKKNMITAISLFNEKNKSNIEIVNYGSSINADAATFEQALIFQQNKIESLETRLASANMCLQLCGRSTH